jgi:hypothetical protein
MAHRWLIEGRDRMMYVEFIERDRFVPIELFRYLADQESIWKEGHVDKLVLQLGRTFRFGPIPSYLAFWQIPAMQRIDVWQTYFGSDEALRNRRSSAMHRGIHVQRAGLYDETLARGPYDKQNWYIEYFDTTSSHESVKKLFLARAAAHSQVDLEMVLSRVGALGPDPAHIAVWSAARFEEFEQLARSASACDGASIKAAGLYRPTWKEIV